jgi:hypothetical protein
MRDGGVSLLSMSYAHDIQFCDEGRLQLVVEYRRIRFSLLGTWHGIGNSHSPTPTIYVIVRPQREPGTSFFRCFRNTLSQAALIFLTNSTRYGKISSADLSAETRLSQVTGRICGERHEKGREMGRKGGGKEK